MPNEIRDISSGTVLVIAHAWCSRRQVVCWARASLEVLSGVLGCGVKSRTQSPAGSSLPPPATCWVTLSTSPRLCASMSPPGTESHSACPRVPAVLLPRDTLFCLDPLPVFSAKQ